MKILFTFLVYVTMVTPAFSQNWQVYNSQNTGMPDNYVTSIAADGNGNVWVGTATNLNAEIDNNPSGGLVRYDGNSWTFYSSENSSLPGNNITDLEFDKDGNLWAISGKRLAKFDGTKWIANDISDYAAQLYIDANGNVFIVDTYYGAVEKFDGTSWTEYDPPFYVGNTIYGLAADKSGNLWCVTYDKVAKFDGADWTIYNEDNSGLPINTIRTMCIDQNDNVWIGTRENGLLKFDGTNWKQYTTSNSNLPGMNVSALAIDNNGNLIVGTFEGGGLAIFDGNNWTVYSIWNSKLPVNDILSLEIDNNNKLYVGTAGEGMAIFDGNDFIVKNTRNTGLPGNGITAFALDENGNKWIGTYDFVENEATGLTKFDGSKWTVYNVDNSGLPSNSVSSIVIDNNRNIWVGTGGNLTAANYTSSAGLAKFDGADWTVFNTDNSDLPGNDIYCLAVDKNNNIWMGLGYEHKDKGLVKFDGTNWTVYNEDNSELPDNEVRTIFIDDNDIRWIGTNHGLARFDGTEWTTIDLINYGLQINSVNSITVEHNGNLWIGTGYSYYSGTGELAKFDGTNWTVYNKDNLGWLTNGSVSCLGTGTDESIWIGTYKGYKVGDEAIGFANFNENNLSVYNKSNSGLPYDDISTLVQDSEGNLWIGTFANNYDADHSRAIGGLAVYNANGITFPTNTMIASSNDFMLKQNYPNPFHNNTIIKYSLPKQTYLDISVFDNLGRKIETLQTGIQQAGNHEINFDASSLPGGLYFYQLKTGTTVEAKKMIVR